MNSVTKTNGNIGTEFPVFEPNQVLTDAQLNLLRDYLDQQERSTRFRLIGSGIVFGLNWSIGKNPAGVINEIKVSAGFGVSSDGYLIQLPCGSPPVGSETIYTHFKDYPDSDRNNPATKEILRNLPWKENRAKPNDNFDPHPIKELLTGTNNSDKSIKLLEKLDTENNIDWYKESVLVLYLEQKKSVLNACFVTNCDNKGQNVNLTVRVLLVPKEAFDLAESLGLEAIKIQRIPPTSIVIANDLTGAIDQPLKKLGIAIADDNDQQGKKFCRLVKFLGGNIENIRKDYKTFKNNILISQINQYRYDAVKDVVCAYNELGTATRWLVPGYFASRDFQRHLRLGALDTQAGYRTEFIPTPANIDRLRKLLARLVAMMADFKSAALSSTLPNIKITPSHTEARPLGERAVPFYFGWSHAIQDNWQPDHYKAGDLPWSYNNTNPDDALLFDYNQCGFLRIEGHRGMLWDTATNGIKKQRKDGNAEFQIINTFVDLNNTLQTKKGVLAAQWNVFIKADKALRKTINDSLKSTESLKSNLLFLDQNRLRTNCVAAFTNWLTQWCSINAKAAEVADMDGGTPLYCDTSCLDADYFELRSGLRCELQSLKAHLDSLKGKCGYTATPANKARATVLRQSMSRWVTDLATDYAASALRKIVLSEKNDTVPPTADEIAKITGDWLNLLKLPLIGINEQDETFIPPVSLACLGIQYAAALLAAQIDVLINDCFSKNLSDFDCAAFIEQYKSIEESAMRLWLNYLVFEAVIVGSIGMKRVFTITNLFTFQAEEDFLDSLFGVIHSCLPTRMAAIYYAYDTLRQNDIRSFDKLVEKVSGLEHLAGVEKGGTFVLINTYNNTNKRYEVKADLSLAGQLLSGCKHEADMVTLPLVARPLSCIYIVKQNTTLNTVKINVLANAYNPNAPNGQAGKLFVKVPPQTQLGVKITLDQAQAEVSLEYTKSDFESGVFDEFVYQISDIESADWDSLPTNNQSRVFILLLPEFSAEHGHGDHPGKWCSKKRGDDWKGISLVVRG